MKILLTILSLTTFSIASGQSDDQKDLVDILNIALTNKELPTELINTTNPKATPWTNAPFIVVKSDKSRNLERLKEPLDSTHVWIFDYEDIFISEIAYGLVPLDIKRKGDKLTLDYKTLKFPSKDTNWTCHSGQLVANRVGDSWTIVKSKTKQIKCEADMYGHKK